MSDRKEALQDLLAKVEEGEVPHWQEVTRAIGLHPDDRHLRAIGAFNGSLDHAKALHEAVLPGWSVTCLDQACNLAGHPWGCEVAYFDGSNPGNNRKAYSGHDHSAPARAWLIAILKALIAQGARPMTDQTGMDTDVLFGAPDPDPTYRNHAEEIEAVRKVARREEAAFEEWWGVGKWAAEGDKFPQRELANLAFLAGRRSIIKEQREEIRSAFPGLPEARG